MTLDNTRVLRPLAFWDYGKLCKAFGTLNDGSFQAFEFVRDDRKDNVVIEAASLNAALQDRDPEWTSLCFNHTFNALVVFYIDAR